MSIFTYYQTEGQRQAFRELLQYGAQMHPSGLSASFLEKDLWVTEILRLLFDENLLGEYSVAFKGGTALSKCWNAIERFSEDIDLSIHWADLAGHSEEDERVGWEESIRNPSQRKRFRELQQKRLTKWTSALVDSLNNRFHEYGIRELKATMEEGSGGEKIDIHFPRIQRDSSSYQLDHVLLEFGGRNRGKPVDRVKISSYLERVEGLATLALPEATVNAYSPGYILWEKLTALHQFCTQLREPNPQRLARHWYDVDCLIKQRIASPFATTDAMFNVVEMKEQRWAVAGVDYSDVLSGKLLLIPESKERIEAISRDHQAAIDGGMFFRQPDNFEAIAERLLDLQKKINTQRLNIQA